MPHIEVINAMAGLLNVRSKIIMSNLKKIREINNLSQGQLAKISDVNVRMIQYYEQGVKDINRASVITIYKLAKALNVSIEDLIEMDKI